MSFSLRQLNGEYVCDGEGMPFLKLKERVGNRIGHALLRTLSPKSFAIPIQAAALAADLFAEAFGEMPELMRAISAEVREHELARIEAMDIIQENRILPLEMPWPDLLDPAQATAVCAMTVPGLRGLCLFDEQGIGKTLTSIAAYDVLRDRNQADCLIVIAPVSMKNEWKKEIEKFLPNKYKIVVLEGSSSDNRNTVLTNTDFDVLVCNYEATQNLLVPIKSAINGRRAVLIVDESFNVKNEDATRSIAVMALRESCHKGFVLCGTPAPNSADDVIHQYNIADQGYTFSGFSSPRDPDEKYAEIMNRIDSRGTTIRRLKEEVLTQLPEKDFHIIRVKLLGRQAALYESARNRLELTLKGMDNTTFKKSLASYFQQRNVLLQICSSPESVDPSFDEVAIKFSALDNLIGDVVESQGRKLIIWSFFRAPLEKAMQRYAKYNPVLLDGSMSANDRAAAVQKFQTDESVRICIANQAAAGAGVTLHSASDAVYLSHSNQAAHFLQSIDRIHRRGQKSNCVNYYMIVCQDSIEEGEVERLREKELNQNRLLGDQVRWPNSLDEALADLKKHA